MYLGYVLRLRDGAQDKKPGALHRGRATRFALIPTYLEEPEFVFRAMLSVALQRHDDKWLRLLVDDLPTPKTADDRRLLLAARALPDRVRAYLEPLDRIVQLAADAAKDIGQAPAVLVQAHRQLAGEFERLSREWPATTADDRFSGGRAPAPRGGARSGRRSRPLAT